MKNLMFSAILALLATPAMALTDYQCVNDCTAKGYLYGLCVDRCTVQQAPIQQQQAIQASPPIQRTDYQCLNRCTQAGYQYGLCKAKCSY